MNSENQPPVTWTKKYRWVRTWPGETGLDGKLLEDYVGYDGDIQIGRIYLDTQSLKKGQYFWAIQYPKGGRAWMPNSGWKATDADAARHVEEVWDQQKARLQEKKLPGRD